jgi:hypothetical protein
LTWAQLNKHYEVIGALLKSGVEGANALLLYAISERNQNLARAIINSGCVDEKNLSIAFTLASAQESVSLLKLFEGLDFRKRDLPQLSVDDLQKLTGAFVLQGVESRLDIALKGNNLVIDF